MKRSRKGLFALSAILILAGLLELVLRIVGPAHDDQWPFLGRVSPGGERQITFLLNEHLPTFASPKPPGVTRIMIFGESASNGFPFVPGDGFPAWLQELIDSAGPRSPVEALNFSVNATNSTAVSEWFGKAMSYEPDVVVFYLGNNDQASIKSINPLDHARAYRTLLWLERHSRLYLSGAVLISKAADPFRLLAAKGLHDFLASDFTLISEKKRGRVDALYAHNLERMIGQAQAREAKVVVTVPAMNLLQWPPPKSSSHRELNSEQQARFAELLRKGRSFMDAGAFDEAIFCCRQALEIAPHHAQANYRMGRALFAGQQIPEAEVFLEAAVEWDDTPLRTPPRFRGLLRKLADDKGAYFLDFQEQIRSRTDQGLPGFDLFMDAVHANQRGNHALAEILFANLRQWNLLPPLERPPARFEQIRPAIKVPPPITCNAWQIMATICALGSAEGDPELIDEAIEHFQQAEQICPPLPSLGLALASLLVHTGRTEAAAKVLTKAWTERPEQVRALCEGALAGIVEVGERQALWDLSAIGAWQQVVFTNVMTAMKLPLIKIFSPESEDGPGLGQATAAMIWDHETQSFRDGTPTLMKVKSELGGKNQSGPPLDLLARPKATRTKDLGADWNARTFKAYSADSYLMVQTSDWGPLDLPLLCVEGAIEQDREDSGNQVTIYWTGDDGRGFSENNKVNFSLPADGKTHRAAIALGDLLNLLEDRPISTLRLDFSTRPATIRLLRMELVSADQKCW